MLLHDLVYHYLFFYIVVNQKQVTKKCYKNCSKNALISQLPIERSQNKKLFVN
jgi:hypothetical protein